MKVIELLFLIIPTLLFAQQKVEKYGACMIRNDTVSGINQNERFALHSVMKFPQALYVADYLRRKGLDLYVSFSCQTEAASSSPFSPRTHYLRR